MMAAAGGTASPLIIFLHPNRAFVVLRLSAILVLGFAFFGLLTVVDFL